MVDERHLPDVPLSRTTIRRSNISYNGDRILVSKFCYQFSEPKRWDVIVFHYPEKATLNFIKRLVGLPGETVRISHGALWIRAQDNGTRRRIRDRPQAAGETSGHAAAGLRQRLHAGHRQLGWPARWRRRPTGTSPDEATRSERPTAKRQARTGCATSTWCPRLSNGRDAATERSAGRRCGPV